MSHPWLWFFATLVMSLWFAGIVAFEAVVFTLHKYEDITLIPWVFWTIKAAFWIVLIAYVRLLLLPVIG